MTLLTNLAVNYTKGLSVTYSLPLLGRGWGEDESIPFLKIKDLIHTLIKEP